MDWHLIFRTVHVKDLWGGFTDIDISALFDLYHGTVDFIYYIIDFLPERIRNVVT